MPHPSETGQSVGLDPETLNHDELDKEIKDRISKVVDIISPPDGLRNEGFQAIFSFKDIGDIAAGSMGINYSGQDPEGESLDFWRFYGIPDENDEENFVEGTGRDACQRFDLYWSNRKLQEGALDREIYYTEWDSEKENDGSKRPPVNSSESLQYIDKLINQFAIVAEADKKSSEPLVIE